MPTIQPNCWPRCELYAVHNVYERSRDAVMQRSRLKSNHSLCPWMFGLLLKFHRLQVQPANAQSLGVFLLLCPLPYLKSSRVGLTTLRRVLPQRILSQCVDHRLFHRLGCHLIIVLPLRGPRPILVVVENAQAVEESCLHLPPAFITILLSFEGLSFFGICEPYPLRDYRSILAASRLKRYICLVFPFARLDERQCD